MVDDGAPDAFLPPDATGPASSHAELMASFASGVVALTPWVIDLTMGAWRPRDAARQLAEQTGTSLAAVQAAAGPEDDIIGWGIDAESLGPTATRQAHADARALLGQMRRQDGAAPLVVWLPGPQVPGEDNGWLLQFLLPQWSAGGGAVRIAWRDEAATPAGGAAPSPGIRWWPGLRARDDFSTAPQPGVAGWYALRGGRWFCCPAWRPQAAQRTPSLIDRLRASGRLPPECETYVNCSGQSYFVDAQALAEAAWQAHREGASDLAVGWLERARDCCREPLLRAEIVARLQGVRIATQRFSAAAAETLAGLHALPAGLQAFLRQSAGWGRVMTGDISRIDSDFGAIEGSAADLPELYRLNIHALGLARAGRASEALAAEQEILARRRRAGTTNARIAYINDINLARLYRLKGDFVAASRHYESAFATLDGVRTHAEAVHAAWIRAHLARAQGKRLEAGRQMRLAALHWLAVDVPDAIPLRVAQAVLGSDLPPPRVRADAMSRTLLDALQQCVDRGELSPPSDPDRATASAGWLRSAEVPPSGGGQIIGADGWALLCQRVADAKTETAPPAESAAREALSQSLAGQLAADLDMADWPSGMACYVDTGHGRRLAQCSLDGVALAVWRGASSVVWGHARLPLNEAQHRMLWQHMQVRIGVAVARCDRDGNGNGATLHFRRHRTAVPIARDQADLLDCIRTDSTVGSLMPGEPAPYIETSAATQAATAQARPLLTLWQAGAIDLALTEETCIKAGIRLPTSAT